VSSIAAIRFQRIGKQYHFDASHHPALRVADFVIVDTTRGKQMGQVMAFVEAEADPNGQVRQYKAIERVATPRDLLMRQVWEAKELEVMILCREKAAQLHLPIKVVRAEYSFDGGALTFFYSADDQVDTKALKREMSHLIPRTNIEMRQIGPRDVAKILGGLGACGIERCCSRFLTEFSPISIKMAKEQGISLNPTEITGMCGRLRCCLIYEYEQYVQARKLLPKRGKRVGTPHGEGKVVDLNPLKETVYVLVDETVHELHGSTLEPLDELEALEKKAKGGCSRHEGGGCTCGANN
jgi:cell fate regulator YaaT (PSP1 superfamily)